MAVSIPAQGQEIPTFRRTQGFPVWNRFAAVNAEFFDLHMDDEAARVIGYPSAIGMGHHQWAYLHALLESWMGDEGDVLRLSCQFRGLNLKGAIVTAHGRVEGSHPSGDRLLVDLDVWVERDDGARIVSGEATVAVHSAGA